MKDKLKKEIKEFCALMRSAPAVVTTLFVLCVFAMNLLANKSIDLGVDYLALDCGMIISWFAFLTMDVLTKHFGPKAATEITFVAIIINLFFCLVMFVGSKIPGVWGESYVDGSEAVINGALDRTVGGTWYVLLGSTLAFAVSAVINNFSNWGINRLIKKREGFGAYAVCSYVSTAAAQFADNMIFAFTVSHVFFGWSALQCVTCAVTGMLIELFCEIAFSYLGYRISKRWSAEGVGKEYFELVNAEAAEEEA